MFRLRSTPTREEYKVWNRVETLEIDMPWEKVFDRLIIDDDSDKGFFPFGGDSHDFSGENCKAFIRQTHSDLLERVENGVLRILADEIATAHTSEAGKTSRLTSAYNRIADFITNLKKE